MSSMWDKVLTALGVREDDEQSEQSEQVEQMLEQSGTKRQKTRKRDDEKPVRRTNLVSLDGGAKQTRVIIIEPTEFAEVRTYVDHLKNKHPLIVRLDQVSVDEARRIVDFMSGATHAIDGNMRKLGELIFLFAPHSVVIEGELESTIFDFSGFDDSSPL